MERRINITIEIAEEIRNTQGGLELLQKAIENTERLKAKGEPFSQNNLNILNNIFRIATRAGENAGLN